MDQTPTPDAGDDYSYDLAHEVPAAGDRPRPTQPRRPAAPRATTRPDEVGDYSYDLAHEVPAAERRDE